MKQRTTLVILSSFILCTTILAQSGSLSYIQNKGQWNKNVLFLSNSKNHNVYLEKNRFTFLFYDLSERPVHDDPATGKVIDGKYTIYYHAFREEFVNANPSPEITSTETQPEYNNYYIGKDASQWASHVNKFKVVNYKGLYPSVDLKVYSQGSNMKYDFFVKPGAEVKNIKINYSGADKVYLENNQLKIKTSLGILTENAPYAYQKRGTVNAAVECHYIINNDNTISFDFPKGYDASKLLVIDPVLIASTYSGSFADNRGYTATYDAAGNMFTGGIAFQFLAYPTTVGAFQTTNKVNSGSGFSDSLLVPDPTGNTVYGQDDITITKFNPTGTTQIYSTYLGGATDNEMPLSLVVNNNDELLVLAKTYSTDFPTVAGYDITANGKSDIAVCKFNSAGTTLLSGTYIGGSGNDGVNISDRQTVVYTDTKYNYGDNARGEIITDDSNNVYVACSTRSIDFPTTAGVIQPTFNGGAQDGCAFKLNSSLSTLVWSTYLGGSSIDAAFSITLGSNQNVYLTGGTESPNFAITSGAPKQTLGGALDGFLLCMSSDATKLVGSTYVGTTSKDQTYFVKTDRSNAVYVLGITEGLIPVSGGVYSNANSGQFIQKFDSQLTSVLWSTVIGSGNLNVTTSTPMPDISPTAFLVDDCGLIYLSGWARARQSGPYPGSTTGMTVTDGSVTDGRDFYLAVLAKNAASLYFGTFIGSQSDWDHVDGGTSRFDKRGVAYLSVCTHCFSSLDDFPITAGAYSSISNSYYCENAVLKYDFQLPVVKAAASAPAPKGCGVDSIKFSNYSTGKKFVWDFGDASPRDTAKTPAHLYTIPGKYLATLIVVDSSSCNIADTSYILVTVGAPFTFSLGNDTTFKCIMPTVSLDSKITAADTYLWSTGATTQTINVNAAGTYSVTVTKAGCTYKDTISVILLPPPVVGLGSDVNYCNSINKVLDAGNSGSTYTWSTGAASQTISVNGPGTYWVNVDNGNCMRTDTVKINDKTLSINIGPDSAFKCVAPSMTLNAGTGGTSYSWNTGSTAQSININAAGSYWVTVSNGYCTTVDSIKIQYLAPPVVNLGSDTVFCDKSVVLPLNAANPGSSYAWSTGATTQSITVGSVGTYYVNVNNGNCTRTDTINIFEVKSPKLSDTTICRGASVKLSAGPAGINYLWSTGQTSNSITITPTSDTMIWVVAAKYGCGLSDSVDIKYKRSSADDFLAPNVFTPNGDGMNDLYVVSKNPISQYNIKIYDRWGLLMFESSDATAPWDGKHSGSACVVGTYYYIVSFYDECLSQGIDRHGFVELLK